MTSTMRYLTTQDNPYDPLEQPDEWYNFDTTHGYNTYGLLARVSHTSSELPQELNNDEIEAAIDWVLEWNPTGNYIVVEHDE